MDKTLTCRDCGDSFIFTTGEQDFYMSRGFTNEPTRCSSCRQARKQGGGRSSGGYGDRDSYGGGGYGGGRPGGDPVASVSMSATLLNAERERFSTWSSGALA